MQGGRDPFSGFGDPFAGFGGFGGPRSLMSSFFSGRDPFDDFFGGRDPFDDPFFRHPFGGSFQSSFFGPTGNPFGNLHPSGFLEQQPTEPPRSRRGPIIEELNSDDEKEEEGKSGSNNNPRKHGRSSHEPFVEHPDDEAEERRSKLMHFQTDLNRPREMASQPQSHGYTFQSSSVSYGGPNGTYYASSKTRRTGSDGLTFEEAKEANSATGQASHGVFRGIHDKGHSVLQKLNSDGRVDMRQTLHNLNEDDLAGFEEAWKGSARNHMPGLTGRHGVIGPRCRAQEAPGSGCRALPSTERLHLHPGNVRPHVGDVSGSSCPRNSVNPHSNVRDGGCPPRVRSSKASGESCAHHSKRR